jgi:hypothetical protein
MLSLSVAIGPALGGARAQSAGTVSDARLVAATDTFETWESQDSGQTRHRSSTWFFQTLVRLPGAAWQYRRAWLDSTGATTSLSTTIARKGDLAVRFDGVQAQTDSAAVVFDDAHATGWVVPGGEPARLFDGSVEGPRPAADLAEQAFASLRPAVGRRLVLSGYVLYGAGPLVLRVDTLTVLDVSTVRANDRAIPCLVIRHARGTTIWVERTSGRILARRGSVAGGRIVWWHVRRGIEPPT